MSDLKKYIEIPFKDKGRDFSGSDCWGLARLFAWLEYGWKYPSLLAGYKSSDDGEAIEKLAEKTSGLFVRVKPGEERPGDLIHLRVKGSNRHVATVLAGKRMLHTMEDVGVTAGERYDCNPWKMRVIAFWRWRECVAE